MQVYEIKYTKQFGTNFYLSFKAKFPKRQKTITMNLLFCSIKLGFRLALNSKNHEPCHTSCRIIEPRTTSSSKSK